MNDADTKVKQQIIEKIKSSTNILVTVSRDPSVDDLSAALGLTALLNRLGKHATAIFSGAIPPAITFLDPEKTFEDSADSLRDFIIALNKEKADHLRYKVDGDVVKIFITPYRTTITGDDLEFSQGDYNVELVLALGVSNQQSLDTALEAHGRILHDATVANIDAGGQASQLGSIDWRDENASSLSEMIVAISEAFKTDKPLIDEQIATALLTGIVAATDRFSNPKTTAKVMTMAAQLMAAGADQQLIAAKLEESNEIGTMTNTSSDEKNDSHIISINEKGEATIIEDESIKLDDAQQSTLPPDSFEISHDNQVSSPESEVPQPVDDTVQVAESPTNSTLPPENSTLPPAPASGQVTEEVSNPDPTTESSATSTLPPEDRPKGRQELAIEPLMGGTLNATTDQAADDAKREQEDQQNKTILSHSYLGGAEPSRGAPINGTGQTEPTEKVDIFAQPSSTVASAPSESLPQPEVPTQPPVTEPASSGSPQLSPIEPSVQSVAFTPQPQVESRDGDDARAAVEAAFGDQGIGIAQPPAIDLPPPPPLPDFSTLPPPLPDFGAQPPAPVAPAPERLGDIFAPESSASTLPPPPPPIAPPQSPVDNDPGQFRIPGQ